MANIYKTLPKATLCKGNLCVTVYGNVAKAIEMIAITSVMIIAIALIAKTID